LTIFLILVLTFAAKCAIINYKVKKGAKNETTYD
jgi:hypothetical protein